MKYVKGLDTLRALAVLSVIVGHWGVPFQKDSPGDITVNNFVNHGGFGVILFFVLSGFLITSILLNERVKNAEEKNFTIIKNFFARRVLRIFPIYYLTIFLCCLFNYRYVIDHIGYFLTYTSNLLPIDKNNFNPLLHTWTLAIEEQFYLIWPLLIIFVNKKYIKHVLISAIIIGAFCRYVLPHISSINNIRFVFDFFDSFGIGGLYAYIRLDKEKCRKVEKGFVILFPLLLFLAWKMSPVAGTPILVAYYGTLNNLLGIAAIMFAVNNQSDWVRKYILENKTMNFIGKISYGLYLYHYSYGYSFDVHLAQLQRRFPSILNIPLNYYIFYAVKLGLLILISWLSFILIEQPIMRLKRKFEYKP